MIATREILKRPEHRKLICILSDGAPGNRSLVNKAVKDARKKGISVYSIFFTEGQVSESDKRSFHKMYEKDYVCCTLDELDKNLSDLFRKFSRG